MSPIPTLQEVDGGRLEALRSGVRMVASDVDGTLTDARGGIASGVVRAVEALDAAGIELVPVSGRPAGELLGLIRYLPGVRRGIAENGLLELVPDREPRFIEAPVDLTELRERAESAIARAGLELQPAADRFCRLGDLSYERAGLAAELLAKLRAPAEDLGLHLVWSNVHVHFAARPVDKGAGLMRCLERWSVDPKAVVTIGDAPNDAGLFVAGRFAFTVGTADIVGNASAMSHLPECRSLRTGGEAFVELVTLLLGPSLGL